MPRPKTIIVDDAAVLAAITDAYNGDVAYLASEEAKAFEAHGTAPLNERYNRWEAYCDWHKERQRVEARGIPYDLPRFAGRDLTPSERIRHQQAVRRLEAAGKVVRNGNCIKPSPDVRTVCPVPLFVPGTATSDQAKDPQERTEAGDG